MSLFPSPMLSLIKEKSIGNSFSPFSEKNNFLPDNFYKNSCNNLPVLSGIFHVIAIVKRKIGDGRYRRFSVVPV